MKSRHVLVAAVALAIFAPAVCSAAAYTVTDLGTLGGIQSAGVGISPSGRVVGEASTGSLTPGGTPIYHPFLFDGGIHDLGTLGGYFGVASSVNDSGQITGAATAAPGGPAFGFLYASGVMQPLGTLGGAGSGGSAINSSGHVAGYSFLADNSTIHAALYAGGAPQDLGTLGGNNSQAASINESGLVVGFSTISTVVDAPSHAFLYDTTIHDLGTPDGMINSAAVAINDVGEILVYADNGPAVTTRTFLYIGGSMHDLGFGDGVVGQDINNLGQIVGYSTTTASLNDSFAFVADGGNLKNLNDLIDPTSGWILRTASALNDNGQIVGWGVINGDTRGFLLTPVPEPSSIVMAVMGLLGLFGFAWHRRLSRPSSF